MGIRFYFYTRDNDRRSCAAICCSKVMGKVVEKASNRSRSQMESADWAFEYDKQQNKLKLFRKIIMSLQV